MPSADVLKQRILAARTLRGIAQADLNQLFAADGLGKGDAGRIERGELDMQRVHRDAFVRHLRVPEAWFTSDDVDELVGWKPRALSADELRQAAETLEQLAAEAVQAARPTPEQDVQAPGAPGRPGQAAGADAG